MMFCMIPEILKKYQDPLVWGMVTSSTSPKCNHGFHNLEYQLVLLPTNTVLMIYSKPTKKRKKGFVLDQEGSKWQSPGLFRPQRKIKTQALAPISCLPKGIILLIRLKRE